MAVKFYSRFLPMGISDNGDQTWDYTLLIAPSYNLHGYDYADVEVGSRIVTDHGGGVFYFWEVEVVGAINVPAQTVVLTVRFQDDGNDPGGPSWNAGLIMGPVEVGSSAAYVPFPSAVSLGEALIYYGKFANDLATSQKVGDGDLDPRFPSSEEKGALVGSTGVPNGTTNKYVTMTDPTLTGPSDPNAHVFTHESGGADEITPTSIDAADAVHDHNADYFQKTEFINTSTGVLDAAKPVVLDVSGLLDSSFIPAASSNASSITVVVGSFDGVLTTNDDNVQKALDTLDDHTHIQYDNHLASTSIHFTKASISHNDLSNTGTNSHIQLDSHVSSATTHFTQTQIDHLNLTNRGANSHATIDTHIADNAKHFLNTDVDHVDIQNKGLRTHAEIDAHLSDSTNHFTVSSIDHQSVSGAGTNTHTQIDTHLGDAGIHFTEASIDHSAISNVDYASSGHTGFAADTDGRFATNDEKNALAGTDGSPSAINKYVTDSDDRLIDARTPSLHVSSHHTAGADELTPASIGAEAANPDLQAHLDSTGGVNVHGLTAASVAAVATSELGVTVATLTAGKVPTSQLPQSVVGSVVYRGTWDADTNSPTLPTGSDVQGDYYKVNVSGTTDLDGISSWTIGDWAIYDGTNFDKVDNTDSVSSVNGNTGAITGLEETASRQVTITDSDTNYPTSGAVIDYVTTELGNFNQDTRYFQKTEFLTSSVGASDSGKPVVLGADGKLDSSMYDATATASVEAISVPLTTGSFDGILSAADSNVQAAMDTIDDHTHSGYLSDTDTRIPTQGEKDALEGTSGTASGTNRYVTNQDDRLSDTRTPSAHKTTHATGGTDVLTAADIGAATSADLTSHTGDTSIHFTEGNLDHANIQNSGTTSHVNLDTHYADNTIHFTEATIDHNSILNSGTRPHNAIDTHIDSTSIHFAETTISHLNVQDVGSNTHSQLDTHLADSTIHFTAAGIGHETLGNLDYASSGHTGFAADTDVRFPLADEKTALAGTAGTPGSGNEYVTNTDSRMSDNRTPVGHASSHYTAGPDQITPANINAATAIHTHNTDYFQKIEFIDTSVGAVDAGKPVVLAADGKIDTSMYDAKAGSIGAGQVTTQESQFDGILSASDTDAQTAFETLDQHTHTPPGADIMTLDTSNFDGILGIDSTTVQLAMDTIDDHAHSYQFAADTTTSTVGFSGILSGADTDVQLALESLDTHNHGGADIGLLTNNFNGILSGTENNVQLAMDIIDDHSHAAQNASGTATNTGAFNNILSGTENDVQKALDILDDHTHTAGATSVVATGFNGVLSPGDNNVQTAMATVDQHTHTFGAIDSTAVATVEQNFSGILSSADLQVQSALETLDQHDHPHTHDTGANIYTYYTWIGSGSQHCEVVSDSTGVTFNWVGGSKTGTFTIPDGATVFSAHVRITNPNTNPIVLVYNSGNSSDGIGTRIPNVDLFEISTNQYNSGSASLRVGTAGWDRLQIVGAASSTDVLIRLSYL